MYTLLSSQKQQKQRKAKIGTSNISSLFNLGITLELRMVYTTEANIKFFRCCNIRNDTFLYTFDLDGKYRNNNNIASSSLLLLSFIEGPRILCQSSYMPYLNLWQMFSVCCSFKDDRFIFT